MSHITEFVTYLSVGIVSLIRRITQRSPQQSSEVNYYSDSKHNGEISKYRSVLDSHAEKILASLDIDRIGNGIGKGSFGEAYVCFKKRKPFALKVQPVNDTKAALNEIELLKQVQHKNVVKLYDYVFVGQGASIEHSVIKFEYLNTSLEKIFESVAFLPFEESLNLAKQLGSTVAWLHQHRIVHHDLKCGNLMCNLDPSKAIQPQLRKVTYKIIDFGSATLYDSANVVARDFENKTDYYCSPEKLAKIPYDPFVSDYFSVGVTLLEARMNPGQLEDCKEESLTFGNACDNFAILQQCGGASSNDLDYLRAVRTLLSQEPSQRASIETFNESLRHFDS